MVAILYSFITITEGHKVTGPIPYVSTALLMQNIQDTGIMNVVFHTCVVCTYIYNCTVPLASYVCEFWLHRALTVHYYAMVQFDRFQHFDNPDRTQESHIDSGMFSLELLAFFTAVSFVCDWHHLCSNKIFCYMHCVEIVLLRIVYYISELTVKIVTQMCYVGRLG